jgi:hypothetical protein
VLRDDNAPATRAARAAPAVVRPRVARGPQPGQNFATRRVPALGLNPAAAEWTPKRGGRSRKQKKTRRRRLQRKTL